MNTEHRGEDKTRGGHHINCTVALGDQYRPKRRRQRADVARHTHGSRRLARTEREDDTLTITRSLACSDDARVASAWLRFMEHFLSRQ